MKTNKKYYRIRTFFKMESAVIPLSMPNGMHAIQPIFTNKKKAGSFLKEQNLPKDFVEEIYLEKLETLE